MRERNTVYHKTFKYLYLYIFINQLVQDNVHALNRTTDPGPGSISTASDGFDSDFNIWTFTELHMFIVHMHEELY